MLLYRYPGQAIRIVLISLVILILGGHSLTFAARAEDPGHVFLLPVVFKKNFDLKVNSVRVIQGTAASESFTVNIANRETMVRVFVGTTTGKIVPGVTARMCGYNAQSELLGCIVPENGPISAPSIESNLDRTLNFQLPKNWLKAGYAFHVDIDPDHLINESDRSNNRYPGQGTQSFNFTVSPALNVMVIPINYRPFLSGTTYLPEMGNLDYLTWMPIKVLPIPEMNYQTHAPYPYFPMTSEYNLGNMTGAGWSLLLSELTTVHNLEDPNGTLNYYGVVNSYDAHGCDPSCISGLSNVAATGGRLTAVGWSGLGAGTNEASRTMVHEFGHNFGRSHVGCEGIEPKPDPNYPYPGGLIGQWGLDVVEGILYDPGSYGDFMSWCNDVWTSDYTYWNINFYRMSPLNQPQIDRTINRSIYISGYQTPDGEVHLEPIYEQVSPLPPIQVGPFRAELLGDQGKILASYPFQMSDIADIEGYSGFGFFVPAIDGLQGVRILEGERLLVEKIVPRKFAAFPPGDLGTTTHMGDGSLTLRWADIQQHNREVTYRLRYSQDRGRTWQVLALKLREPAFRLSIGPGKDSFRAIFEVQATDGIHTSTIYISTYGE